MRVGLSWLREHVDLPADISAGDLEQALVGLGIEVDSIADLRASVRGPLVVGRVLTVEELTGFKKPIRFCTVDVGAANGTGEPQEIVCGANNFAPGDLVVVILPGGVLPGGFEIGARKTYGHMSAGMITLGPRAGAWATTTRASSCCRRTPPPRPATTPGPWSGSTTSWSRSRSLPTGGTRCRSAASPASSGWPWAGRSATRRSSRRPVRPRSRPTRSTCATPSAATGSPLGRSAASTPPP